MIKDCREITVKAVRFPCQSGTVFYVCLPCDAKPGADHSERRTADQTHLVSILREHLAEMDGSSGTDGRFSNRSDGPSQIVHNPLGRPQLLLGNCDGPAISFSEGGGKLWAALCDDASDIGIDAAGTEEFSKEYPFHRVFHAQEFGHALRLTGGDWKKASALLWSIKEAAVKALGCAFHLVDPLHICVDTSAAETDSGFFFTVRLSGKARVRFPIPAGLWVRSLFHESMWLSIALLNRQQKTERP